MKPPMPAACRIRPATLDDLDALLALEALFPVDRMSRRNLRWALTRANATFLVAITEHSVIGYGLNFYRRNTRQGHLYSIITHPDHRGQGIADAMLAALEREARQHDCTGMQLEVQTTNTAAIGFYEKHGYVACGIKPGYYDNGSDALKMAKPL